MTLQSDTPAPASHRIANAINRGLRLPAALLVCWCALASVATGGTFRAAAAKVDVTPEDSQILVGYAPRQSTNVHDRLHHRLLLLDDGETSFLLISSEFSTLSPEYYDRIANVLAEKSGIPVANIWWTVTHTHSAPSFGPRSSLSAVLFAAAKSDRPHPASDPKYTELVEQRLFEGLALVTAQLEPARLAVGWGFSQANINRRARDAKDRITLGMDPDGAVDRRIGLLRIDRASGEPLALVANYPMHGTVLGGVSRLISGDAPGNVAQYVEEKIGVPMLYINGAAGNIAPLYSQYGSPESGHLSQFSVLLGNRILSANDAMRSSTDQVKLSPSAVSVVTPRKEGLGWPDELADYAKSDAQGVPQIVLPIKCLRINRDIMIWSAPLELFCEVSNEIRDRSPFEHTFYFGYTNGWLGYLLTAPELKLGGYEATVSPFSGRAADDLTEAVLTHLKGLPRDP